MKHSRDNLLQLIRLMDGLLPPEDEQFLRTKLVEDESLRKKYKRLSELCYVDSVDFVHTPTSSGIDEEVLAAFVDERLEDQDAERVESVCWESPSLLSTVVSTFRFVRRDFSEIDVVVPEQLTCRLKMLVPASESTADTLPADTLEDDTGNDLTEDTVFPGADSHAIPFAVSATESARRKQRSSALVAGVAVAIMAAMAIGVWYLVERDTDRSQIVDDKAPQPRTEQPLEDNVSPAPQQKPPGTNVVKVEDNQPEKPAPRPEKIVPTPRVPPVVHQRPKPVPRSPRRDRSIQWVQTAGVIARRDAGSRKWVGLEYGTPGNGTTTYSALPGSWAEAEFQQGFSLVLDADTEVRIPENVPADTLVDLELSYGRLALRSLDQDQIVRVHLGPVTWILKAVKGQASLGLVWSATRPTLFVTAGTVAVEDRQFSRGREVAWSNGAFQKASSLNIATNWTKGPPDTDMLDAEWRRTMKLSDDLQATLLQFQRAQGPAGLASVKWQCALSGGQYVPRILGVKSARMRNLAVQWMLSLQPGDKRLQPVLDAVARQAQDPKLATQIRGWLRAARDPKKITPQVLTQMARQLNHNRLGIRHIADQLLRKVTGRTTSYRPDAPPAQRQRLVLQWTTIVRHLTRP